ncbi:MAG: tetratricopeptide repeat protein [Pleurocapsa sp. MO_226.B13]|nr:tetratricopeptide repeat protein [Pleurocapsa sp. MO_226.B13]
MNNKQEYLTASKLVEQGRSLSNLNKSSESLAVYDRALKLEPDYHYAWCKKTAVLIHLGRSEECLKACDRAWETKPNCNVPWDNKAIASFDKAIAIKPNCDQIWHKRSISLMQLGRYKEASIDYQRAIEISFKNKIQQILQKLKINYSNKKQYIY